MTYRSAPGQKVLPGSTTTVQLLIIAGIYGLTDADAPGRYSARFQDPATINVARAQTETGVFRTLDLGTP